jgi:hypothetical protein
MTFHKSTEQYETWLASLIPLISADLEEKHEKMREAVFPFLRATFYRWAQTFPEVCKELEQSQRVLGVGDLHVENFGTWRDAEGRLAWGINDFDEACEMPYTCDLVRLATSAHFAINEADNLKIDVAGAIDAILHGYRDALGKGGGPYVLDEHHSKLRHMAVERLKDPKGYWDDMNALETLREKIPSSAAKALERALPSPRPRYRIAHRVGGLGALGRRRFTAIAEWKGGTIAREAKNWLPSAWLWARGEARKAKLRYEEILDGSIRCHDPFLAVRERWVVRRLAPDCSRIELSKLPKKHEQDAAMRLLRSMGWETANVHLGSTKARNLLKDLEKRKNGWLHRAASAMVESVNADFHEWRKGA